MPDLDIARESETRKLAALNAGRLPIAAAQMRQAQFANAGIPVQGAAALAREFEHLILRLATLEAKFDELQRAQSPVHLKNLERRTR